MIDDLQVKREKIRKTRFLENKGLAEDHKRRKGVPEESVDEYKKEEENEKTSVIQTRR